MVGNFLDSIANQMIEETQHEKEAVHPQKSKKKAEDKKNKFEQPAGLEFKLPSGRKVRARVGHIPTSKCAIWKKNNRMELTRNDESLEELVASIKQSGQAIPGLVMPSSSQDTYEVIYGSRRFAACQAAGVDFYAAILEDRISEKEALILMSLENSERKDISVYEKALSYKDWLSSEIFKDTEELANSLGVTRFHISRILQILELPEEVIGLFPKATDIKRSWVTELTRVLKSGESARELLIKRALRKPKNISEPLKIYEFLIKNEKPYEKKEGLKRTTLIKNNEKQCDIIEEKNGRIKVVFESKFSFNDILEKINILTEQDAVWEITNENGIKK